MVSYRGLLLSLVAIAGSATAAAVVYRYATRGARSSDEPDDADPAPRRRQGTRTDRARDRDERGVGATTSPGDESDWDDEFEPMSVDETDVDDQLADAVQIREQQLVLVAREGNAMLSMIGLIMLVLVGLVGVVVAWASEQATSPLDLPMFQPLLWLALGVFTASTVDVLGSSEVATSPEENPVLSEKSVFPHDQGDFEMIERYYNAKDRSASGDDSHHRRRTPSFSARRAPREEDNGDEEEKAEPVSTAGVPSLVTSAEALFKQNQHMETYSLLKQAIAAHPTEIELLWRLARACNHLVEESTDLEQKKAFAFEGLSYADACMAADANSAASNKWKGIMTGAVGNFRDLKDKIAGAYVIRDHIQRAIALDPTDATCHNILGQWCLAFADMTWIEKRAAAALFGKPPSVTYDEAVAHFLNAEKISPGFWKKNVFLLAQTYHKMNRLDDARAWVLKARDVPTETKEDADVEKDIAALMKKLGL